MEAPSNSLVFEVKATEYGRDDFSPRIPYATVEPMILRREPLEPNARIRLQETPVVGTWIVPLNGATVLVERSVSRPQFGALQPEINLMRSIVTTVNAAYGAFRRSRRGPQKTELEISNQVAERLQELVADSMEAARSRFPDGIQADVPVTRERVTEYFVTANKQQLLQGTAHVLSYINDGLKTHLAQDAVREHYGDGTHYSAILADAYGVPLFWFAFSVRPFAFAGRPLGCMVLHAWGRSTLSGFRIKRDPEINGACALSLIADLAGSLTETPVSLVFMKSLLSTSNVIRTKFQGALVDLNAGSTRADLIRRFGGANPTAEEDDMWVVTEEMRRVWTVQCGAAPPPPQAMERPSKRGRIGEACIGCSARNAKLAPDGNASRGTFCSHQCYATVCALLSDPTL